LASIPAFAQTYTPKQIRMEGSPATDSAELLRIAKLTPGTAISVPEIEAALQRLGDTGMFSDIRYSVDSTALVFKLTPIASSQSLPARYANFVWWQPSELEHLVEARVPGFHGALPSTGNLTGQVEAALVSLLHEKDIDATVTALASSDVPNGPPTSTALTITQPHIVLGDIHLSGSLSALKNELDEREHTLSGQDLDIAETSVSLREYLSQVFQNAGYLDIAIAPPTYSAPRKAEGKNDALLLVDATTTVHPGDLYRIARVDLSPTPPIPSSDISQAANLKVGAPASASGLSLARAEITKACTDRGYLDAAASVQSEKNNTAHTMAYTFSITLGEIYHLASIDTSSLTPTQQQNVLRSVHVTPGTVVDKNLIDSIIRSLRDPNARQTLRVAMTHNRADHTAKIAIKP
jgi:outer membrane protein assembly factor BamA